VSAIVNAISALRAKLGGGAESPIVTKSGRAGIVRTRSCAPPAQLLDWKCPPRS